MRHRQQELIEQKIPQLAGLIRWLDKWPNIPFSGVIIANEVLDAMPVYRFMQSETEILESYVTLDAQDQLAEIFKPTQNQRLLAYIKNRLPPLDYPYLTE
ncbi:SAM-dependent methyltransferase, partial [Pseudomonas aeruginosa]|uniref:SAM-dependent methyltransferase n=1 Tax=Pseudomonas aeruginosa TaxID=287 RepID=UPI003CF16B0C